ncbi:MAG: hypothetical protein ACPGYV_04300, partial [Phycisphaeraceae bacterium]
MGPWFVRDEDRPFMPGFSETILRQQVAAGRINANTIVRGPTTNQFWMTAGKTPGVSRLMGACHACDGAVSPEDIACPLCEADLSLPEEVDRLGLAYVTSEARSQAQREIEAQRTGATPQRPKSKPSATIVSAEALTPVDTQPPVEKSLDVLPEDTDEDASPPHAAHDDGPSASDIAEDVWHAEASPAPRRRRLNKKADPLVVGMSVMFLCVLGLGMVILLTGGKTTDGDDADVSTAQQDESTVERDAVAVSRASVPALTAYERLNEDEIPEPFVERYASIQAMMEQARADREAERYNLSYDAYTEARALIVPLEEDIAAWQLNELARGEAIEIRDRVQDLRSEAQDAEASRWAAASLATAESIWEKAAPLLETGRYAAASDSLIEAQEGYDVAIARARAGREADAARVVLNDAMRAGASEALLRKLGGASFVEFDRLKGEAEKHFNERNYDQAEPSYRKALAALKQAQRAVEFERYKKVYAYRAGVEASSLMLASARGDGVEPKARQKLAEAFDRLDLSPNPASKIEPGDEVGFTATMGPLVAEARDAIAEAHGQTIKACYLIGFHANLISQTLETNALTREQQKRIHQSLGVIEKTADTSAWDTIRLRTLIDPVRVTNRNADLNQPPEATRVEWAKFTEPMDDRDAAAKLMDR